MADQQNPLDNIGAANEEGYHKRRDAELVEKLREKMASEARAETLRSEANITDEDLSNRLGALGITPETLPVLHLVPLLQVAWADGEIQDDERGLLLKAGEAHGVTDGPAAALLLPPLPLPHHRPPPSHPPPPE